MGGSRKLLNYTCFSGYPAEGSDTQKGDEIYFVDFELAKLKAQTSLYTY
jgi:hypothetical protein